MDRQAPMIAACGCALLGAAASSLAQTSSESDVRTVTATASEVFQMADVLFKSGATEKAHSILRVLSNDPDADVRNEARFRRARMLNKEGKSSAAALLLRQVLDENPNAVAARLHLAAALRNMGDESAALRELRALRSADLPKDVATFVDQASASLLTTKPFGVHVEVALAPDSNVNRATSSGTLGTVFGDFILNPDARAKSGVGFAVRAASRLRFPIADSVVVQARATQEATLYRQQEFNDVTVGFLVGPQFRLGKGRTTVESGILRQWFGMKPYQRNIPLSASVTYPMGPVAQVGVDAAARWAKNDRNRIQSGRGFSGRLRYEHAVSTRSYLLGSIGADRYIARDEAYSTQSWTSGLSASHDVGRMTITVGVELGRLRADERFALLPRARRDKFMRLQIGSVIRRATVAGFAPIVRLLFEQNRSTVEFYDFRRVRTEVGVSRAF